MASTFTTRLRLEKMADGEKASVWGQLANIVFDLIDSAIAGMATLSTTGGTYTLSTNNSTADEARMCILKVAGALVSNATIVIPAQTKEYTVWNATSGAFTVAVKTAGGASVAVTQGKRLKIMCDGTDCYSSNTDSAGLGLGTAALIDVGTAANKIVQLDSSAKLPAVDGSQLTGLAGSAPWPSTPVTIVTANGTVTIPTGATRAKASVVGSGAAGGGGNGTSGDVGGGGGGGATAIKWLTGLTPGNTLTATVGAGGTGNNDAAGNAGAQSSLASGTQTITTISANGGNQGTTNTTGIGNGGAAQSTTSGADITIPGSAGSSNNNSGNTFGGSTPFGHGGMYPGALTGANGTAGNGYGAGGSGSPGAGAGNGKGGDGTLGVIMIEWYS